MLTHTVWDNSEKTVLLQTVTGGSLLEEFFRGMRDNAAMMATVPHTVHVIVDLSQAQGNAGIKDVLSSIRYSDGKIPSNQGTVVLVGGSSFIQAVLSIVRRLAPKAVSIHTVDTLAEARQLIAEEQAGQVG